MGSSESDGNQTDLRQVRVFVESTFVAIVLAFVLRAFLVEAFVIPTGSMATTLYGANCRLMCDNCGLRHEVGTSGGIYNPAKCPNCGNLTEIDESCDMAGGDRILVMKYVYHFIEPRPWDVVVFKNPQNNRENYIKRLIGVPGESIQIIDGDIFARSDDDHIWKIRRKPEYAQESLWILLHDNDHVPRDLDRKSCVSWIPAEDGNGWDTSEREGRNLIFTGQKAGLLKLKTPDGFFDVSNAYNDASSNYDVSDNSENRKFDQANDLKLQFVLIPGDEDKWNIKLEFVNLDELFVAGLCQDGTCTLSYNDGARDETTIQPFRSGKGYIVEFSKVDYRLQIRINGQEVLCSDDHKFGNIYEQARSRHQRIVDMTEKNGLSIACPVRVNVEASGGCLQMRHVRLYRDVYYTPGNGGTGVYPNPIHLHRRSDPDLDEFFCLGDNSPSSSDGRFWDTGAATLRWKDSNGEDVYQLGTVPRYNMIGRAVLVYWPSGFKFPLFEKSENTLVKKIRILPNGGRMRFIK